MNVFTGRFAAMLLAGQAVAYCTGWAVGKAIHWGYRQVSR